MPYDESFLNNPPPDILRRRHIVPLARFSDDDVASMDYDSWKATASRYEWHPDERKKMEELIESIRWEGLRNKVHIVARGALFNVADGHHRVVALRRLGWTHVPYRWYRLEKQPLYRDRTFYERAMLPESAARGES